MNLLPKTLIKGVLNFEFDLIESGWYLISVSSRVKAAKQRGKSETDDEDLRVEVDGQKFPKLENKTRYFDSPAAFSGGLLKNNLQVIYFCINLNSGRHKVSFVSDNEALLESMDVTKLLDFPNVHIDLNTQAERSQGRPWLTFVFCNLGIPSFRIKANTSWGFPDGDDIKIIVDGKIKENYLSILHRKWIFASNIIRKLLGGETFEKTFTENLPVDGLHYLEFWSDETPTIYSLDFELAESPAYIRKYKSGLPERDYNRFDTAIDGQVKHWNHEFSSQSFPPPEPLDPNLVKAMIYVESTMGYGPRESYPDVMQVGNPNDPAIHTLRNDGWIDSRTGSVAREYEWYNGQEKVLEYKEAKVESTKESIYWGVRWLYHKAQGVLDGKRYWKTWEQAVKGYNGGGDENYLPKVLKVYEEGVDINNKKLWLRILIIFLFLVLTPMTVTTVQLFEEAKYATVDSGSVSPKTYRSLGDVLGKATDSANPSLELDIKVDKKLDESNSLAFVTNIFYPGVGLAVVNNSNEIKYYLEGSEYKPYGSAGEYVDWMEIDDFNGDGKREIAVEYIVSGTGLFHPFYIYQEDGSGFKLVHKRVEGVSHARLIDVNDDGRKEFIFSYSLDATGVGPREWTRWTEVWGWNRGNLVELSNQYSKIYESLIHYYDYLLTEFKPDDWLTFYYPMLRCLKDAAQSNIKGVLASGESCKNIY